MPTLTLRIENMHCGSCVRRVMQTLNALPGTHAEEVRVGAARVSAPGDVGPLLQALQAAGFPAHLEASGT